MTYLAQLIRVVSEIGPADLVDIAIVTLVLYAFLVALKRTRRSGLIFTGIAILGLIYVAARLSNLVLTVALLQGFFAVILVALVVIFQEDLRYFFERVGLWWRERSLPLYKRRTRRLPRREVEVLARTLGDLARARIGALVVVRGRDVIARHLEGGEEVQGLVSEPLLKSIFDPHSIGHDGAVIIEGNLISRLGVHLPLSKNLVRLARTGTRHAAGLGLAERTDALCLVVSEERGTMSAARRGDIGPVEDAGELARLLESFYDEVAPKPQARVLTGVFRRNFQEKVVALGLAVVLWVFVVYRAENIEDTLEVSVQPALLPSDLVATIEPSKVKVTFSGERKEFAFLKPGDIKLTLQLWDAKKGRRQVRITGDELTYPHTLELENIEPRHVMLEIEQKPNEAETARQ